MSDTDETPITQEEVDAMSETEVAYLLREGKLSHLFGDGEVKGEAHRTASLRQPVAGRGAKAQALLRQEQRARALRMLNDASQGSESE